MGSTLYARKTGFPWQRGSSRGGRKAAPTHKTSNRRVCVRASVRVMQNASRQPTRRTSSGAKRYAFMLGPLSLLGVQSARNKFCKGQSALGMVACLRQQMIRLGLITRKNGSGASPIRKQTPAAGPGLRPRASQIVHARLIGIVGAAPYHTLQQAQHVGRRQYGPGHGAHSHNLVVEKAPANMRNSPTKLFVPGKASDDSENVRYVT